MNYRIYKLKFKNGVHFGNGTLDESAVTFQADVLFFGTLYRGNQAKL